MEYVTPALIRLPEMTDEVASFLTYQDTSVGFQLRKVKRNYRWAASDPEGYAARVAELEGSKEQCMVRDGNLTYSGLARELCDRFGWQMPPPFRLPSCGMVPWSTVPPPMRPYQAEAVEVAIRERHCAICLPTGSGKSRIITQLCKELGVKTVITAPLAAVVDQLYRELLQCFGRSRVGKYGDGRKDHDKLFTVAVAQSLVGLEPGDDAFESFRTARAAISDEAHTLPAETFERVYVDLLQLAPWRISTTATHMRTNGSHVKLLGLTGPVAYQRTYEELANSGYLAKMKFFVREVDGVGTTSDDPKRETRQQLYTNPRVIHSAASMASSAVQKANQQVLILVEEFKQIGLLAGQLQVPFAVAHGGVNADNSKYVPEQFRKCNVEEEVRKFNSGETRCLIGTSAVSTGVDLRPVGCLIYLQGGISGIKVRQALGRGTRVCPGKDKCLVVDFSVSGSKTMERHLKERVKIYQEYGEVRFGT